MHELVQDNAFQYVRYASQLVHIQPSLLVANDHCCLLPAACSHHIMNLGHGIEATTPEDGAKFFVETVQRFKH
jgi:uroporphyrinogen-III decarboxylase